MNLLHVITSIDPVHGGPGQVIRSMVPALEKLNIQSEVVCLDSPSAPFVLNEPFKINALGPAVGLWRYSSKLMPWLYKNLNRFDGVILHGLWLYSGYATSKVFQHLKNTLSHEQRLLLPRLFVMPHGMLDPYFQRAADRKFKSIRNWIYWRLIERNVVNRADGIFFTCEAELLLAREPFNPYHPQKEMNVGFGIEQPPAYTPKMREEFLKACPEIDGHPYLLFLSRIHQKKGVDLLVNGYLKIAGPGAPKLVIAGPGLDGAFGQEIKKIVTQNPQLKDVVLFPGMLSGDAKWGAFYGCEAFVLPSHQENFGIAVAEALACGKPVLISNQVNIWKEIKNGGGGLISDDTTEGTKSMLLQWSKLSQEMKAEMASRANQIFKESFSIGPAALKFSTAVNKPQAPDPRDDKS